MHPAGNQRLVLTDSQGSSIRLHMTNSGEERPQRAVITMAALGKDISSVDAVIRGKLNDKLRCSFPPPNFVVKLKLLLPSYTDETSSTPVSLFVGRAQ